MADTTATTAAMSDTDDQLSRVTISLARSYPTPQTAGDMVLAIVLAIREASIRISDAIMYLSIDPPE